MKGLGTSDVRAGGLVLAAVLSGCSFVDEVRCETDQQCVDAGFGDGATCAIGACVSGPTVPMPTGDTGPAPIVPMPGVPPECVGLTEPIVITSDITEPTTWRCPNVPYHLDAVVRVVGNGALSVTQGVDLRMAAGTALVVDEGGELSLSGTVQFPVDITGPAPTNRGDWVGVVVGTTAGEVLLDHVDIVGGGGTSNGLLLASHERAGLLVFGRAAITDVHVSESAAHGMLFGRGGVATAFDGNRITGTDDAAIRIGADAVGSLGGLNLFDEDVAEIEVDLQVMTRSATWADLGVPYRILASQTESTLYVGTAEQGAPVRWTINGGVELRFEPGVAVKVGWLGEGGLHVNGEYGAPVLFTSTEVDPQPGDWGGIYFGEFVPYGEAVLTEATIEFAGPGGEAAVNVSSSDATLLLDHCVLRDNGSDGLAVDGYDAKAEVAFSSFERNGSDGLSGSNGAYVWVYDSFFKYNDDEGMTFSYGGDPINTERCTFEGNGSGAMLVSSYDLGRLGGPHFETEQAGFPRQFVAWDEAGVTVLDRSVEVFDVGLPYYVQVDILVGSYPYGPYSPPPSVLTVWPGTEFLFDTDAGIFISPDDSAGGFVSMADATNPATFSGYAGGTWSGLHFEPGSSPVVTDNIVITNAVGGFQP